MMNRTISILMLLIIILGTIIWFSVWCLPVFGESHGEDLYTSDRYERYLLIHYLLQLELFDKAENLIDLYLVNSPNDPFILTEKAHILSETKGQYDDALKLLDKALTVYPNYYYANYLYAFIQFTLNDSNEKKPSIQKENIDKSIKYLEVSIEDNPDYYDSFYLLGVITNSRGDYEKSNDYLKQANRLNQTAAAYLYMASNYLHLHDVDNALIAYKEILSFNPTNFRALSALSEIYMDRKEFKAALTFLEQLYQRYPMNKKISLEYLFALVAAGDNDKFMEISKNIDISDSPVLLYAKALLLTKNEKYSEAENILKDIHDKDLKTYLLLTEIQSRQHNYHNAYQLLEKIGLNDRDYLYYSVKLEILSSINMNRRILQIFDIIKQDDEMIKHLEMKDLYIFFFAAFQSELPEKIKEIFHAIKNFPIFQEEFLRDLDKTLEYLYSGEEIPSELPQFELNISLLEIYYKQKNQYTKASELVNRLIPISSDSINAYLELCDLYLEQQKFEKFERLIESLSSQFPSSLLIKNYYAYYLAKQNKNLEYALKLSAATLSQEKENPAYNDTYGYILLRMGRIDEAGDYLERAYQKNPFEIEIIEHMVDYYKIKKDINKIRMIYQNAIDQEVDFKDKLHKELRFLDDDKKNTL